VSPTPLAPGARVVRVPTNGIELSVHLLGAGPAVLLVHGFPDLAYSWRRQAGALAAAGYSVIAPDMRGYGQSDRPSRVESYDSASVGADLIGLLDALDVDRAAVVGHDWGAASVWPLVFSHPDRVRGIAGLSVPFAPVAPVSPLDIMRRRLGDAFYMVRFQAHGEPERELERDVEATFRVIWSDLHPLSVPDHPTPEWLAPGELAPYVAAFSEHGFSAPLNYYRNIERNWVAAKAFAGRTTSIPALFLTGDLDMVASFMPSERMQEVFTLVQTVVVPGAGHWVHQQHPRTVNAALLDFLTTLPA